MTTLAKALLGDKADILSFILDNKDISTEIKKSLYDRLPKNIEGNRFDHELEFIKYFMKINFKEDKEFVNYVNKDSISLIKRIGDYNVDSLLSTNSLDFSTLKDYSNIFYGLPQIPKSLTDNYIGVYKYVFDLQLLFIETKSEEEELKLRNYATRIFSKMYDLESNERKIIDVYFGFPSNQYIERLKYLKNCFPHIKFRLYFHTGLFTYSFAKYTSVEHIRLYNEYIKFTKECIEDGTLVADFRKWYLSKTYKITTKLNNSLTKNLKFDYSRKNYNKIMREIRIYLGISTEKRKSFDELILNDTQKEIILLSDSKVSNPTLFALLTYFSEDLNNESAKKIRTYITHKSRGVSSFDTYTFDEYGINILDSNYLNIPKVKLLYILKMVIHSELYYLGDKLLLKDKDILNYLSKEVTDYLHFECDTFYSIFDNLETINLEKLYKFKIYSHNASANVSKLEEVIDLDYVRITDYHKNLGITNCLDYFNKKAEQQRIKKDGIVTIVKK